jgi:hypothetical protein
MLVLLHDVYLVQARHRQSQTQTLQRTTIQRRNSARDNAAKKKKHVTIEAVTWRPPQAALKC